MVFTRICQKYRAEDKKAVSKKTSLKTLVDQRLWPKDGMPELKVSVEKRMPWGQEQKLATMNDKKYREFLKLFGACLYTDAVQGRVGAWASCRCSEYTGQMIYSWLSIL